MSGQVRDCLCKTVRHEHGTVGAYHSDRCRCARCRAAVLARYHRRKRAIIYGRWEYPTHPAGTVRRLRALSALGWNHHLLAQHTGITLSQIDRLLLRESTLVFATTARAVRDAYDRLWDQAPPQTNRAERRSATIAKQRAASRGWHVPLSWDEDTIDDPAAQPSTGEPVDMDEVAIEEVCIGRISRDLLTREELAEAVRRLAGRGYSDADIADRLGYERSSVSIIRARLGIAPAIPSNRPVVAA